jgi:ABC-type sulfate transport system substrate-binding protein
VLSGLKRQGDVDKLVEKTYTDYLQSDNVKRICVEYYKDLKRNDILKKLQGYDYKKDRFIKIKPIEERYPLRFYDYN